MKFLFLRFSNKANSFFFQSPFIDISLEQKRIIFPLWDLSLRFDGLFIGSSYFARICVSVISFGVLFFKKNKFYEENSKNYALSNSDNVFGVGILLQESLLYHKFLNFYVTGKVRSLVITLKKIIKIWIFLNFLCLNPTKIFSCISISLYVVDQSICWLHSKACFSYVQSSWHLCCR